MRPPTLGFFYRLPLLSALWPLVIHFEIVPQAGRHMLQVLSQEKDKNLELLNVVHRREAAIDLFLKTFHINSSGESKLLHSLNFVLSVCVVG